MPYTIVPLMLADRSPLPGRYFKSFDHEAHDGLGEAEFTDDPGQAISFPTHREAIEFYLRQSMTARTAGRTGPMTWATVSIQEIECSIVGRDAQVNSNHFQVNVVTAIRRGLRRIPR